MHALAASAGGIAGGIAGTIGIILLVVAGIAFYWIPAIVAWQRHVPNAGSVTVINGLLGWTLVGWTVALAMACRSHLPQITQPRQIPVSPQPGDGYR